MGNAAGDDVVLDLSMKKPSDIIIADSTDVVRASSSFNSLPAAVPGSQQRPGVSLVQLPTSSSINNRSSNVHGTGSPLTPMTSLTSATTATLLSHSVAGTSSRFQLSFTPLTHSHCPHSTAIETAVQHPSCDAFVPRFSSSRTTQRVAIPDMCEVTADVERPRLKRCRLDNDEATCTRSETTFRLQMTDSDTSQQSPSTSDHLQTLVTTSEPLITPQSSDDVSDYVERRRKNNEAAKRSRDARRLKEQETAVRAAALEQDNVQLRAELAILRTQAAKLHSMLYNKLGV